jgi:hypothetical protein
MLRAALLVVVAAVLSLLPSLLAPYAKGPTARAQGYSCRGYPPASVVMQVLSRVEALRRIEREAADRIAGLDTRPYEWLLEQAKAGEAAIAVPTLLAAEEALGRCRNFIQPVRMSCALGAAALVRVIGELVAGEATAEAKMAYAQVMPKCEQALKIKSIETTLRAYQ